MPIDKNQSPKAIIKSLLGNVDGVEDSVVEDMVELFESVSIKSDEDSALIEHLQKENDRLEKHVKELESSRSDNMYTEGLLESLASEKEALSKNLDDALSYKSTAEMALLEAEQRVNIAEEELAETRHMISDQLDEYLQANQEELRLASQADRMSALLESFKDLLNETGMTHNTVPSKKQREALVESYITEKGLSVLGSVKLRAFAESVPTTLSIDEFEPLVESYLSTVGATKRTEVKTEKEIPIVSIKDRSNHKVDPRVARYL